MGIERNDWPKARELLDAANEATYPVAAICTLAESERHVQVMLDPPADLACKPAALTGLAIGLEDLANVVPGVDAVRRFIAPAIDAAGPFDPKAASEAAIVAFSRRKKYHYQYLASLHLGLHTKLASPKARAAAFPLSKIIGVWAVRLRLDGWRPSKHTIARVIAALSRPTSRTSLTWSREQREDAARNAIHELQLAITRNPTAAAALGLASSGNACAAPALGGVDAFNARFRRRINNLLEYKSSDSQAGAGGNGTLCAAGLTHAGRDLMSGVRAGRHEELHVCLEILSHLTSDLVQLLPVQLTSLAPEGALAWLDVPGGAYWHTLFKVVEKGARPDPGTESLYEATTQLVKVRLSPPLADAVRRAAADQKRDFCTVNELLGKVSHGPYDAVAGQGPYRVTASKMQASLPALLLQRGEFRWAVAIATTSPFVISRGRPAYGVGRQERIDQVIDHVHDLLSWPRPDAVADLTLVGSFTAPRPLAILTALAALAGDADACPVEAQSVEEVVASVNAHAAYLAILLALCYALRNRVIYPLPTRGLRAGGPLKFNDKDVHDYSMPAVPTLRLVREAVAAWAELLSGSIRALRCIGTDDALALAELIASRLQDHDTVGWIFTITVAHTLEPIGTHTWRERLLPGLRLVENFGRQFWPHRLADLGVCQLDSDVLMRHQMPAQHPGSSHVCRPEEEIHERLIAAMSKVVECELNLPVPHALRARAAR